MGKEKKKSKKIKEDLIFEEIEVIDAIFLAKEEERNRIAKDLHDHIGSKIATLKLYIEYLEVLGKKDINKEKKIHKTLKKLINQIYIEIREIANNKNFDSFIEKGLITATKLIAKEISSSKKLKIKVENIDDLTLTNNKIEIQIFRCIQESITNIIKHAKASEVNIQFSKNDINLCIIIEDNGIGFNNEKIKKGMGLINMENRIHNIGGKLFIDSTLGNGTTIILNIPLWK